MSQLALLIIKYKYLVLFPIAAIEGPIVSLIVGFLIWAGYLQFIPAYVILILGDLIPDTIYYYLGRYGNHKQLMAKYGTKLNFISENFSLIQKLWRDHPVKTMFFSKLAYGLSTPFLISAGLVNMPLRKFWRYSIPVTLIQYAAIMALGYYLGHSYNLASQYIKDASLLIAGIVVILIIIYFVASRYARRQIIELEETEK